MARQPVKQRLPQLLPWLDQRQPDVVCLQETKLTDEAFTALLGDDLAQRGYAIALHGEPAMEIIVEAYGAKHIEY